MLVTVYNDQPLGSVPGFSTYLAKMQQHIPASSAHWGQVLKGSQPTSILPYFKLESQPNNAPQKIEAESTIDRPRIPSNLTLSSLVSAAWAMVLYQITGSDDLVFGNLLAGRNCEVDGISEIFGPCINVVPVRARVNSSLTSGDFIASFRDQSKKMGAADSMGLHEIVKQCTEWPAGSTLDSVLYHQGVDAHPELRFAGATARTEWFDNPYMVLPHLGIASFPSDDHLRIQVIGHTHMLAVESAESLVSAICHMIKVLSKDLTAPLLSCTARG